MDYFKDMTNRFYLLSLALNLPIVSRFQALLGNAYLEQTLIKNNIPNLETRNKSHKRGCNFVNGI